MNATTSCLPLWLVKYGGAPVAIVAAVDRAAAARDCEGVAPGLAIGDMSALMVGTAKPGVRGIVASLYASDDAPPAPAPIRQRANTVSNGYAPALRTSARVRDISAEREVAFPAFLAACRTVEMTVDEVRAGRSHVTVDVRHAFWSACDAAGISHQAAAQVSASTDRAVREYRRNGGYQGPDFAGALEAATRSIARSRGEP